MKFILSRYFRFIIITSTLGFCTTHLSPMENEAATIDIRQARMLELNEHRKFIQSEIVSLRNSDNPNKLGIIAGLERMLANVEIELRLLLDPDIQNATKYIGIPVAQYIQVPVPYMVPVWVDGAGSPLIPQQAPQASGITETKPDKPAEDQQGKSAHSETKKSEKDPVPVEASPMPSEVPSVNPLEQSEIKPAESKKIERSWAEIAATQPKKDVPTLRLANPKTAPAVKKFTPRPLNDKTFFYTVRKPLETKEKPKFSAVTAAETKSKQEKTCPKEEVAHAFACEASSSKTETDSVVSEIAIPEETSISDDSEEEVIPEKTTEKKKSKGKRKGKQKRKVQDDSSSHQAACSKPQIQQNTGELEIRKLWNTGMDYLEQIKSIPVGDLDETSQGILASATQIFEEIFSLQQNVDVKKVINIDELRALLTILKTFDSFFVVEALIVRISFVYDFSFEKILGLNKYEFIQNFIQKSSAISSEEYDQKPAEFFIACLVLGCIFINGIETEISEHKAIDLFIKIILEENTPDQIRFEAIGIAAQIVKRIPGITVPTIEHIALLKLSFSIIPFLIAYNDLQNASSAFIIAEQFYAQLTSTIGETLKSIKNPEQQHAESTKAVQTMTEILKLSTIAQNAFESKIPTQPMDTKQKKSSKTKKTTFSHEDMDSLSILSALCFVATLHNLKYNEPLDEKIIGQFLKKSEDYLETIQTIEGTPFNFTLAKVYSALAQIMDSNEISLKYLRIAHRLSPLSKVYKFDFAKKLLSALNLENIKLAISLFTQLADELQTQTKVDRLCAESAFIIGFIYRVGPAKKIKGFQTNRTLADKYLTLAAKAGQKDAIKILKEQSAASSSSTQK